MGSEEPDAGRALWLAERALGIGGSDAAAILGLGKYGSALDVWLEKTGRKPQSNTPSEPMWWGTEIEDLIARRYMVRTGRKVWKPDRVIHHADYPIILGTPDRLVIGQSRGVEVKNVGPHTAHEWGAEGTDQVPQGYLVQVCQYMAVTGYPLWDVIGLFGGNETKIYTVARDLEFERSMIERLVRWWNLYVVGDVKPPVDERSGDALEILYPNNAEATMLEATTSDEIAAITYLNATDTLKRLEQQTELVTNVFKDRIGNATGIAGDGWKATWKLPAPRKTTDWEKAATMIAERLGEVIGPAEAQRTLIAARAQAVVESPGSRRFLFKRTNGG